MDLPFVGLTTFARQPACTDWDLLDGADVAVLGVPIDTASSYRVGARFGPRAIREASMFHSFGPEGVFDFEDEVTYLAANEVQIVDAGDSYRSTVIATHEVSYRRRIWFDEANREGLPCPLRLLCVRISTPTIFDVWPRPAETRARAAGCWRWPRSTRAAAARMRLGSGW
nr:arginase family protein [Methylobacterium durans]